MIDYVMGDEEMREKIGSMRVEDKMDSDHHPVVVWIKGEEQRRRRGRGNRERIKKEIWNEKGREAFRRRMEGIGEEEGGSRREGQDVEERISGAIEEVEKEMGEGRGDKRD